jgi:hypothetical protein
MGNPSKTALLARCIPNKPSPALQAELDGPPWSVLSELDGPFIAQVVRLVLGLLSASRLILRSLFAIAADPPFASDRLRAARPSCRTTQNPIDVRWRVSNPRNHDPTVRRLCYARSPIGHPA